MLEIDGSTPKLQMTPSPPSRAYIIDRNLATNLSSLVQGSTSDTPGALFSIFQFSPTFEMVLDALTTNELTVAFNSKGGGTDMQLKLELDVVEVNASGERRRSDKAKKDFLACLGKLGEGLK